MEDKRTELTTEQMSSAISSLKKTFQEGIEVLEILENSKIINESVEYLIEAEAVSKPVRFKWNREHTELTYFGVVLVREDDPKKIGKRYPLVINREQKGTITDVENIGSGNQIENLPYLIRDYPLARPAKDWEKLKGNAIVKMDKGEKEKEIHWYQHPHPKYGGAVDIKIKKEE
jgi:hypothetical protein